jgi:serine/threonine protein kinase
MQGQPEPAPGAALAAGTCLGKYQVVRLIGEGGMGAVYEGVHLAIGKKVAIKILSPELASSPDARARFLREAQLTSRVRHPHAVDVTDVGTEAGQPYLVMELLEGEDLASFIQWRGRLPLEQAADIMLPVVAAVAAAHDEGIVHRDLKPHNIFLSQTRDGAIVPKVVDFGISKAPREQQPAVRATPTPVMTPVVQTTIGLMGSPGYLAPEQIEATPAAGVASDQYGLGIILYECVTGRPAFDTRDDMATIFDNIVKGRRTPAGELRADLPEALERIIDRATDRDPAARFPSVRALGKELLAFASPKTALTWARTFGDGDVAAAVPAPAIRRRVFARWIVAALVALAAAGTIAGLKLRPRASAPPPETPAGAGAPSRP